MEMFRYYMTFPVKWSPVRFVSMVGSNGSGKSTLLKAISGIVKPFSGEIEFLGERIDKLPPHKIVALGIAHVPEGRQVFGKLSVAENLMMGAFIVKDEAQKKDRLQEMFDLFPILAERSKQAAETLSGGEQQMLAIARGLMSNPKLLLIDELSFGAGSGSGRACPGSYQYDKENKLPFYLSNKKYKKL